MVRALLWLKNMNEIEKILQFIVEIEQLKNVYRKTRPVGVDRYENSAEHSWHVSLLALLLKDHSNEDINIDRVIRMLLVHDLGEIDAGDEIIYSSETLEQKFKEEEGMKRRLQILPENQAVEYLELWREFEAGESPESKYAKAIDRIPPILHNLYGDGHSWRDNHISKEKVYDVNSRISKGSVDVWNVIKKKLDDAVEDGLLK